MRALEFIDCGDGNHGFVFCLVDRAFRGTSQQAVEGAAHIDDGARGDEIIGGDAEAGGFKAGGGSVLAIVGIRGL
jgi:hypothetical protein